LGRYIERTILRKFIVGLIAMVALSAKFGPCLAAGALAAGVPDDVAKQGLSLYTEVNSATSERAQKLAVAGCKNIGSPASKALCKVVATFSNQCAAEAMDPQNGTPGFGWAVAANSQAAKNQALANCRATAGPTRQDACVVGDKALWCDGSAK
jgi:Domain of unknown function (DUF4189)